jgi:phosphatidylglycerophosphate synthase
LNEPRELGLMHRFYKPMVFRPLAGALPARVHPNVITLTGQLCAVAAAVAAYWGARGLVELYPLSALLHFVYLASDNVDGIHARSTGQVSFTGEVLDHGLDGIAIVCLALTLGFVLRLDGAFMVTFAMLPSLAFLLAHWEHQQTRYFGPITGQADGYTLGVIICLVAFAFDNPPWLELSFTRLNAAGVLVLLLLPASLVAVGGPSLRSLARRAAFGEVAAAASIMAFMHVYPWLGGSPWLVAATVGVFGTTVGLRAITLRVLERQGRLLRARDACLVLPALLHLLFSAFADGRVAAYCAAGAASLSFGVEFWSALREFRALDARRAAVERRP